MRDADESKYVPALRFAWLTPYYDLILRVSTRERSFKQALIRQAAIGPGHRVLDVGCGTGTLSIWIKADHPKAEIVGVDGDSAILSLASRKAKDAGISVQFDQAMAYDLPYPNAHFDRVVSSLFFHHLSRENKSRTIEEIYRVLKPGGQLHVADWGRAANPAMRGLFLAVQLLDGFRNTQDNVSGRLPGLFKHAGLIHFSEMQNFATVFGTMALYSAGKPTDGEHRRAMHDATKLEVRQITD